jgi:hypothetical protein
VTSLPNAAQSDRAPSWWKLFPNWAQVLVTLVLALAGAISMVVSVYLGLRGEITALRETVLIMQDRQASVLRRLDNLSSADTLQGARVDLLLNRINEILVRLAAHEAQTDARLNSMRERH